MKKSKNFVIGGPEWVAWLTFGSSGPLPYLGNGEVRNFKFKLPMQNAMPMTINKMSNRNREYNSYMVVAGFHKSELAITQPWIEP